MNYEDYKESVENKTNLDLMKDIELGKYKCEAGPLERNIDWGELKERFEKMAVRPVEEPKEVTYIDRMRFERHELCTKLNKLIKFQITETFKNLDDFQKEHLSIQCYLMQRYLEVLNDRIIYELELNDKK